MKQSRYFLSCLRCIIVGAAQENNVSEAGFECSLSHLKLTREIISLSYGLPSEANAVTPWEGSKGYGINELHEKLSNWIVDPKPEESSRITDHLVRNDKEFLEAIMYPLICQMVVEAKNKRGLSPTQESS